MPLIASPRHTAEDLRAWKIAEAQDAAYSRTQQHRDRVARAMRELVAFADGGPFYVSVSWGKDSVCVAHLAISAAEEHGLTPCLGWVRYDPIANPDCERVRDEFLARFPAVRYEEVRRRCVKREDGTWDSTASDDFVELGEIFGTRRYVTGVRAEESAPRRRRMRCHGYSTAWSCAPIGWWLSQDVFAYLYETGLPIHPAYAMSMGGRLPRRRLRVSAIGGSQGREWGRAEWEALYYPELAEL